MGGGWEGEAPVGLCFSAASREVRACLCVCVCVCVILGCGIGSSRAPPRAVFVVWERERFICFAQH